MGEEGRKGRGRREFVFCRRKKRKLGANVPNREDAAKTNRKFATGNLAEWNL